MGIATTETLAAQREEIELAADRLDALVKAAIVDLETQDYWKPYEKETAWRDGFTNGFGGESSELAGVLTPYAMAEIVRLMRSEVRSSAGRYVISPHLLAFARDINAQIEAGKEKR